MRKPKFVLLTLEYPPDVGGISRYLAGLVEASHGEIQVIVDSAHTARETDRLKKTRLFRKLWPRWWPMVRVCRTEVSSDSVILVSHVFPVGTAAWISRVFGGPEYAVLFHGTDLKQVAGWWKRLLFKRIVSRAKFLMVNSEATKQELLNLYLAAQPLAVLPGTTERRFLSRSIVRAELGIQAQQFVVLSVGRLVPRKGIDVALPAIAEIQKQLPVTYVVIGNGPDRDRLLDLQRQCGARVTWIPNASDEMVNKWYAAADLFLLPGRNERGDVAGFEMVFIEAGQAELPVIAGRSGGAMEAVVDNVTGVFVDPTSVADVVAALKRLLSDSDLRKRIGEAGKARASMGFRWSDRWAMLLQALKTT